MRIEEINEDCKDVGEYNCVADDILTEYCEQLQLDGMTREQTEDDPEIDGCTFMWTGVAMELIEAKISELYEIGQKYFYDSCYLSISSHMYKEG